MIGIDTIICRGQRHTYRRYCFETTVYYWNVTIIRQVSPQTGVIDHFGTLWYADNEQPQRYNNALHGLKYRVVLIVVCVSSPASLATTSLRVKKKKYAYYKKLRQQYSFMYVPIIFGVEPLCANDRCSTQAKGKRARRGNVRVLLFPSQWGRKWRRTSGGTNKRHSIWTIIRRTTWRIKYNIIRCSGVMPTTTTDEYISFV